MCAKIPGRATILTAEFAREVTLIDKAAAERHLRQGLIRVDQCTAGYAQTKLPQVFLRRKVETALEFAFERPDGHVRQTRQLRIGDRQLIVVAQVCQD